MNRLEFKHEWVSLGGSGQPELDCTFARVHLLLDSQPILRAFDKLANSTYGYLLVPIYPLAEWIAARWWSLLEEADVPGRSDEFLARHSLKYVGEGFAFPDLRILPQGGDSRVEYVPLTTTYQSVDFIGPVVDAVVSREDVIQFLTDIVTVTLGRLSEHGIQGTWLQSEWATITAVPAVEQDFCVAAAWLGLDPFDVDAATAASIVSAWPRLGLDLREDTFRAASPDRLLATAAWVEQGSTRAVDAARQRRPGTGRWSDLRGRLIADVVGHPVREGQQLARAVRRVLGVTTPRLGLDTTDDTPVPVIVASDLPPVPSVDAIAGWADAGPCCYTARRANTTRRFAQARSLFEYLTAVPASTSTLLSTVKTVRQQTGRVFAAELLAPAALLKAEIGADEIAAEEVNELATVFDVSPQVISNQIWNNRLTRLAIQ